MEIKKHKDKQPKYPAWFEYFLEHELRPTQKLLNDVIRLNNLKTYE